MTANENIDMGQAGFSRFPYVYEYLGVHRENGTFVFRVRAPRADAVYLTGDFCGWDDSLPMLRVSEDGIFEIREGLERVREGQCYKYRIREGDGTYLVTDPYATVLETPPNDASVVCASSPYPWRDAGWMCQREKHREEHTRRPLHIYQLHIASWKRHGDGRSLSYPELATELAPYVKQLGYTHVQLMALTVSPAAGQEACSRYAPNAALGSPEELKAFIDSMHEAGIGVILEWRPPTHVSGGSGTQERIANAAFWLLEYHADGLCACLGSLSAEKHAEQIRAVNQAIAEQIPSALRILYRGDTSVGGDVDASLGFDYVFHAAWQSEALAYLATDPLYRKFQHGKIIDSLCQARTLSCVLPLSCDAVSRGRSTLLEGMAGDGWQKLANHRLLLAYQITHPGKKLSFMGNEIGQVRPWRADGSVEWERLAQESHARLQLYAAELHQLYLASPPLWETDGSPQSLTVLEADRAEESVFVFCRRDAAGETLTVVLNATPVIRQAYSVRVPCAGTYEEIFNSDAVRYGGSGVCNPGAHPSEQGADGAHTTVSITLPPLGAVILRHTK